LPVFRGDPNAGNPEIEELTAPVYSVIFDIATGEHEENVANSIFPASRSHTFIAMNVCS
jgi:hypothetical protein